jgi:integrase
MATRKKGGWQLRLPPGRTIHIVRFRHGGKRIDRSTGCSDPSQAAIEAARIYGDVVSGRQVARVAVSADLETAMSSWLADYEMSHTEGTSEVVTGYVSAQFLPFFGSFERFTAPTYGDFMRRRIQQVTRSTLRKELSALRMFVAWANENGMQLPPVPGLPKHGHPGKRSKNARKRAATILTPAEIHRLLVAMPERSPRNGTLVRPFFELLWETALRPFSTVAKIEAPVHYKQGSPTLFIAREIDKSRYERTIPLTDEARSILDRYCPQGGLVFPDVEKDNARESLGAACRVAGFEDRKLTIYDFRHSRISYLANSGAPLAGVAFLVGHRHVSTTALYVTTNAQAAEAALAIVARPPRKSRAGGRSGGR